MTKIHVKTNINGDKVEFLADPRETLLDCLRDHIGLTVQKRAVVLVIVELVRVYLTVIL